MRRLFSILLIAVGVASAAQAQSPTATAQLSSTTCPGATGCVVLGVTGLGSAAVQINNSGTYTAVFEGSIDGVTFSSVNMTPFGASTAQTSTTSPGLFVGNVAGLTQLRKSTRLNS